VRIASHANTHMASPIDADYAATKTTISETFTPREKH